MQRLTVRDELPGAVKLLSAVGAVHAIRFTRHLAATLRRRGSSGDSNGIKRAAVGGLVCNKHVDAIKETATLTADEDVLTGAGRGG